MDLLEIKLYDLYQKDLELNERVSEELNVVYKTIDFKPPTTMFYTKCLKKIITEVKIMFKTYVKTRKN